VLCCSEEPDDHDDVEYLGTSNGTKDVHAKPETSDEKTDDVSGDGDKATTDDTAMKEPPADFTVTQSKDGELTVVVHLYIDGLFIRNVGRHLTFILILATMNISPALRHCGHLDRLLLVDSCLNRFILVALCIYS